MSTPSDNIDYTHTSNVTRMHAAAAREKGDPISHSTPISLGIIAAITGIAMLAGSYFSGNTAGNYNAANIKGYVYVPEYDGVAGGASPEMTPEEKHQAENWIAIGKGIYSNQCSSCHQPHGNGLPGQFPPLNKSEFVVGGEERLAAILLHGVVGQLTVNGATVNGVMLPLGSNGALNDVSMAQVMSYIRNSWDNKASVVYEDQVKEVRKKLGDRKSYSEAELRALPEAPLPKSTWPEKIAKAAGGAAAPAPAAPAGAATAPAPAPAPAPAAK